MELFEKELKDFRLEISAIQLHCKCRAGTGLHRIHSVRMWNKYGDFLAADRFVHTVQG